MVGGPGVVQPGAGDRFHDPLLDPAGSNPDRSFAIYVYDSSDDATMNYDRVLVAPEKDAAGSVADLARERGREYRSR